MKTAWANNRRAAVLPGSRRKNHRLLVQHTGYAGRKSVDVNSKDGWGRVDTEARLWLGRAAEDDEQSAVCGPAEQILGGRYLGAQRRGRRLGGIELGDGPCQGNEQHQDKRQESSHGDGPVGDAALGMQLIPKRYYSERSRFL